MDNPFAFSIAILIGFIALIQGADKFVHGASTTARHFGISPLVIGLTIVSLGTSAPEIFTSAVAAFTGAPDIAIGNVIGSNIANIGLIVGCTALIAPLKLPKSLLRQEIPALLIVTFVTLGLFLDGDLDWMDGCVLVLLLAIFLWRMYHNRGIQEDTSLIVDSDIEEYLTITTTSHAMLLLLAGLVMMVIGSNVLVWGARNIALTLGVSELVIGLTIVAIGTSLPELATTITSVLKGHHELAVGNVVGSNILNLLIVLPVPAFISRVQLDPAILSRDVPVMIGFTLLLSALVFRLLPLNKPIGRYSGAVFIIFYFAYTGFLIFKQA